jgi:5-hydroxyisourate hydrolase-like protein (transthyretin family)
MPLLALVLWLALGATQQATNGSVEGHVFRSGTTEPIEGVRVSLTDGPAALAAAFTDKEGRFSFSAVVPGRYTVRIQRDGYLVSSTNRPPNVALALSPVEPAAAAAWNAGVLAGQTATNGVAVATVAIRAGEKVPGLAYFLIPGGTISGRVLDNLGRPAASASITALRLNYQEGRPAVFLVKTATTNDRGEYRMFWMEPGEYYIRASKALPTGPARAYYPGADTISRALKVRVSEGAESPKIDIALQRVVSFRISGTVASLLAGVDVPVQDAQFYLIPAESEGIVDGELAVQNQTLLPEDRAAGKFLIANVPAGRYDLVAVLTDRKSSPPRTFMGRAEVDVPFQDAVDASIVIGPSFDLPGKVVSSGRPPLPATTRVQLRPKGLFASLPFAANLSATPAPDGSFTIPNLPDLHYSVSMGPLPANTYISDIRQGSFSVFDIGTIGVAGRGDRSFEIVLDAPGATINGKVTASPEQLAAGVSVVLIPDERRRENLTLYKRTTVSANGSFSFSGVAPGRYKLFAWESIPLGAEQNAEFMDTYRDDGTEITVVPGDTPSVELRLIPK